MADQPSEITADEIPGAFSEGSMSAAVGSYTITITGFRLYSIVLMLLLAELAAQFTGRTSATLDTLAGMALGLIFGKKS